MKNDLLTIGIFTIHGYGLMIAIGIIAALLLAYYRAKSKNLDFDKLYSMVMWAIVLGYVASKLTYYITIFPTILENPRRLLDLSDGFVVYGGIIGGIATAYFYCKRHGLRVSEYIDLAIPSVALAQGFGRLGCFLAGCCYGNETSSAFHIIFRESAFAPNNVQLIPTQLISSFLDFANCFLLLFLSKRVKHNGQITALYFIFYSIGRFALEFFRGDLIRGSVGSLTTSQFISPFVCVAGIIIFMASRKKQKSEI
ncbi:prolipoprotein diacylglyceryl transferase [Lachnospiraceae bacterium ZAX-1]